MQATHTEKRRTQGGAGPIAGAPNGGSASRENPRTWGRGVLWAWCIGLAAAAWAMRTAGAYAIVQTDAARHAMNGVFLRDFVVRGRFTDVLPFARAYYAHFPALSMPYHPPLFPAIEALFYLVFGVHALVGRVLIALAVGGSALLLFHLVKRIDNSVTVAAVSTVVFLCLPQALWLGSDVMLEFPALVFTLLALRCLEPVEDEYTLRRALVYALLSAAGVWTKQQVVFLGAVPFLYFALRGQWGLFRRASLWISSAVFAAAVAALSALSIPFDGAGVNQAIPAAPVPLHVSYMRLFWRNLTYYVSNYSEVVGTAGLILVVAVAVASVLRVYQRRTTALYTAWIVASLAVPFLIRPYNTRYLFFTLPPMIALGFAGLRGIALRLNARPWVAAAVMLVVGGVSVARQLPYRVFYLHGPDEAARWLAAAGPKRILYCGETDGNFIFSYRAALDGPSGHAVITADKLPAGVFRPGAIEQFAHDYGIEYVVTEDLPGSGNRPWASLQHIRPSTMIPEREIPIRSSTERWNGALHIYRFTNPSEHPKDVLSMRMWMSARTMDFRLE